jgi:dTMP kinase
MTKRGGLFIVLEGVEGAGKSTQARLLSSALEAANVPHVLTREPGGTPVGEAIREVVLDKGGLAMPPETELFLILGARAAFVREVVRPALERGEIVLGDRFDLSTFAYQGFGRGLDLTRVREANRMATDGLEPDLCLILDLPVELGMDRKAGGERADRIEREGADFLHRVRNGYLSMARDLPYAETVDARGTPEEIQARVWGLLEARFPETFGGRGFSR